MSLPSYLFNVDYIAIMGRVERRVRGRVRRGVTAMFTDYATDGVLGDIIKELRAGTLSTVTLYRSLDVLINQSELLSDPIRQALDDAGLSVMRIASRDVGESVEKWAERSVSSITRADVRFDPNDTTLISELRSSGDLFWDGILRETIRGIRSEVERSYFNNDSATAMADRLELATGLASDQTATLDSIRRTLAKGPLQPVQRDKALREAADKMRGVRSERIARTELNRIVNSGAVSYWQQMARRGMLDYNTTLMEWNTHPDERSCDVCAPLDGISTVIGGFFAPGIVMPPAHPNCRCSLELKYKIAPAIDVRVVKRDGDGDGLESRNGSADIFPVTPDIDIPKPRGLREASERIPTRLPKNKEDRTPDLSMRLDTLADSTIQKMVDRLRETGAVPKNVGAQKNKRKAADEIVQWMVGNIRSVYDQSTELERQQGLNWYTVANRIALDASEKYGMSHEGSIGMMAALSPSTKWDVNLSNLFVLADALNKNEPMTRAHAEEANRQLQLTWAKKVLAHKKKVDKAQGQMKALESLLDVTTDSKERAALSKKIAAKRKIVASPVPKQPDTKYFKAGKRPSDYNAFDAGYVVRGQYPDLPGVEAVINPDGTHRVTIGKKTKAGKDAASPWQSYENLAKAITIWRDPSYENISSGSGEAHKVRTFRNNISTPKSRRNEACIDTHSTGISLNFPVTVTHPWIKSGSKSIMSAPDSVDDGTVGTYAIMAEAHRLLAEELGVLPNEIQAITWITWQRLHPPSSRASTTKQREGGKK